MLSRKNFLRSPVAKLSSGTNVGNFTNLVAAIGYQFLHSRGDGDALSQRRFIQIAVFLSFKVQGQCFPIFLDMDLEFSRTAF